MTEAEWESEVYRLADAYCAATSDEDRAQIARKFFDEIILPFGAGSETSS